MVIYMCFIWRNTCASYGERLTAVGTRHVLHHIIQRDTISMADPTLQRIQRLERRPHLIPYSVGALSPRDIAEDIHDLMIWTSVTLTVTSIWTSFTLKLTSIRTSVTFTLTCRQTSVTLTKTCIGACIASFALYPKHVSLRFVLLHIMYSFINTCCI